MVDKLVGEKAEDLLNQLKGDTLLELGMKPQVNTVAKETLSKIG